MIVLIGSDPEHAASWKKIRQVLLLVSVVPWIAWEVRQVTEDKPVSAIKQENKTPANNKDFILNFIKSHPATTGWLFCLLDLLLQA